MYLRFHVHRIHSSNSFSEAPGPSQQSLPDSLAVSTPGLGYSGGNSLFLAPKLPNSVVIHDVGLTLTKHAKSLLNPHGKLVVRNGQLYHEVAPAVSESKNHGTALETFQFGNSTMTASTRKELMRTQRTTNGLWSGSWAFPGQDYHGGYDTLDDLSCARCTDFMCHETRASGNSRYNTVVTVHALDPHYYPLVRPTMSMSVREQFRCWFIGCLVQCT